MFTTSSKTMKKKSLLLLSSVVVCGSAIFGNSNQVSAQDAKVGPIWQDNDAKVKCPAACAAIGKTWNGHWRTTVWGRESVCGCQ